MVPRVSTSERSGRATRGRWRRAREAQIDGKFSPIDYEGSARALAFSNGEVINVEDLGLRPTVSDGTENERAEERVPREPVPDEPRRAQPARPVRVSDEGIPESLPDFLDQAERDAIQRALEKTRYNRTTAAKMLGITFRALRYRMQRLGIN